MMRSHTYHIDGAIQLNSLPLKIVLEILLCQAVDGEPFFEEGCMIRIGSFSLVLETQSVLQFPHVNKDSFIEEADLEAALREGVSLNMRSAPLSMCRLCKARI